MERIDLEEYAEDNPELAAGLVFTRSEERVSDVEVTFEYADHDVTISDSYVLLEERRRDGRICKIEV